MAGAKSAVTFRPARRAVLMAPGDELLQRIAWTLRDELDLAVWEVAHDAAQTKHAPARSQLSGNRRLARDRLCAGGRAAARRRVAREGRAASSLSPSW